MAKIIWDDVGEKFYETGVDHGVLFPYATGGYEKGVAWNGLISVAENPSGADANDLYADNDKYLELRGAEKFGATVEAYTYPEEFAACDGSVSIVPGVTIGQQTRKPFGLYYRTKVGNDENEDLGYKHHFVYNAKASPSSKTYNTVNESPEAITFSWELTTTPVAVRNYKKTSHIEIDDTKLSSDKKTILNGLLDTVYGTESAEPSLPSIEEILNLFDPQT